VRQCRESYDIVFYDPPYGDDRLAALADGIFFLLSAGGVFAYEHARERPPPRPAPDAAIVRHDRRVYGITVVDVFVKAG
jgi:16S rRNA G966 N2-methylase RsmD